MIKMKGKKKTGERHTHLTALIKKTQHDLNEKPATST